MCLVGFSDWYVTVMEEEVDFADTANVGVFDFDLDVAENIKKKKHNKQNTTVWPISVKSICVESN